LTFDRVFESRCNILARRGNSFAEPPQKALVFIRLFHQRARLRNFYRRRRGGSVDRCWHFHARSSCLLHMLLFILFNHWFNHWFNHRFIRRTQSQRDKIASAFASPKKSHNSISISKLQNSRKCFHHEETKMTKKI